jgi:hypothetical protein
MSSDELQEILAETWRRNQSADDAHEAIWGEPFDRETVEQKEHDAMMADRDRWRKRAKDLEQRARDALAQLEGIRTDDLAELRLGSVATAVSKARFNLRPPTPIETLSTMKPLPDHIKGAETKSRVPVFSMPEPPMPAGRVLNPDEMLIQELAAMVDARRYGETIIIDHGKLRWILEAVKQIHEQRDEARGLAERFRSYVPKDLIVPLFIPWEEIK